MVSPAETRQFTRHFRLRLARVEDAAFILSLRTDPARNAFVSPVADDLDTQRRWLEDYAGRERAGSEYYFIVESAEGENMGTARIHDIAGDTFVWGSWIMKPGAPAQASIESTLSIYEFAFRELGLREGRFEIFRANQRVVAFKRRFGARVLDEGGDVVRFRLTADEYDAGGRRRFARFLIET